MYSGDGILSDFTLMNRISTDKLFLESFRLFHFEKVDG